MSRPVVIKVGGSLLDWPGLPPALEGYLASRRADRPVLVVGGGRFADALRELDRTQSLGEARSHALALRVLDVTAHALAAMIPGLEVVEDVAAMAACWSRGITPVLAPRRFLDVDDRSADPLPHAWSTTTDAIAARLAVRIEARELILLKSAYIPAGTDRKRAAKLGLVDSEFVEASRNITDVSYLNLRNEVADRRVIVLP